MRVVNGIPLPAGWSGKQHACATLATHARYDLMVFVDADVRLAPDALNRMAGFMERRALGLASGFPRQVTRSWAEVFAAAAYSFPADGLSPDGGRWRDPRRRASAPVAGSCSLRRSAPTPLQVGTAPYAPRCMTASPCRGHSARAGFMTGLFDATDIATCPHVQRRCASLGRAHQERHGRHGKTIRVTVMDRDPCRRTDCAGRADACVAFWHRGTRAGMRNWLAARAGLEIQAIVAERAASSRRRSGAACRSVVRLVARGRAAGQRRGAVAVTRRRHEAPSPHTCSAARFRSPRVRRTSLSPSTTCAMRVAMCW